MTEQKQGKEITLLLSNMTTKKTRRKRKENVMWCFVFSGWLLSGYLQTTSTKYKELNLIGLRLFIVITKAIPFEAFKVNEKHIFFLSILIYN